jgi:hypothetical protein
LPHRDADVEVIGLCLFGGVNVSRYRCSCFSEYRRTCCLFAIDEEPPGLLNALLEAVVLGVDATVELAAEWKGLFDRQWKLSLLLLKRDEYEDFIEADLRLDDTVREFSNMPGMFLKAVHKH